MKISKAEKIDFAVKLKAKLNAAFEQETQNPDGTLSYLGVCKITTMIEGEFVSKVGKIPKLIQGACQLARAFRNPEEIKSKEELRKGLGLLITTVGGLSIVWAILSAFSIWTVLGVVLAVHTPFLGPIVFFASLAVIVTGVYSTMAKQTPQALSAKAHDILIDAISNWADEKSAKAKDVAAKEELKRKLPSVEAEADKPSILWRAVTWLPRYACDYIEGPPQKPDQQPPKPPGDEK
jgi:hypothetical protein